MTGWIPPSPAAGNMAELQRFADDLATLNQNAQWIGEGMSGCANAVRGAWSGPAHEAWQLTAQRPVSRAGTVHDAGVAVKPAVEAFLADVARIEREYTRLADRIESAVMRAPLQGITIEISGADLGAVTNLVWSHPASPGRIGMRATWTPPCVRVTCTEGPTTPFSSLHPKSSASLLLPPSSAKADALASDINSALAWIDDLYVDRQAADDRLASVLRAQIPADWPEQLATFQAAGIPPSQMTPETWGRLAAEQLAGGLDHGISPQQAARLEAFFREYGNDPRATAAFIEALGGDGVVQLIDRLGQGPENGDIADENALWLGQQTRAALSGASVSWTAKEAESFTAAMIDEADVRKGGQSAIGFLFAAPATAPMGKNFTVSMAGAIDARDRGGWAASGDASGWTTTGVGGGSRLWAMDTESTKKAGQPGWMRADDPMGVVLETLALYPDAARDWLTDSATDTLRPDGSYPEDTELDRYDQGTLGRQRLLYYFGERDWSAHDGFEGVGALWDAVAPELDGSMAYDSEVWATSVDLTSAITTSVANNPYFLPEGLSREGATNFAHAIEGQLPLFGEYPVTGDPKYDLPVESNGHLLGVKGVPMPNVNDMALSYVMGPVADTTAGGAILADAVADYRAQTLDAVRAGRLTPEEGLDRALQMEMQVAGSSMGSSLGHRGRIQESDDQLLQLGGLGAASIDTGFGSGGAFGLGAVVGALQGAASDFLFGRYEDDAAIIDLDVTARRDDVDAFVHQNAWAFTEDYFAELARNGVSVADAKEIGEKAVDHAGDQFFSELGRWQ